MRPLPKGIGVTRGMGFANREQIDGRCRIHANAVAHSHILESLIFVSSSDRSLHSVGSRGLENTLLYTSGERTVACKTHPKRRAEVLAALATHRYIRVQPRASNRATLIIGLHGAISYYATVGLGRRPLRSRLLSATPAETKMPIF